MAQTAKTDLLATCIQPFVHVSELVYFFQVFFRADVRIRGKDFTFSYM